MTRRPVVHLSLAPLDHDARIMRSAGAIREAGVSVALLAPGSGLDHAALTPAAKLRMALSYPLAARLGGRATLAAFFTFPAHRAARDRLEALAPGAIHAHDWDALAVADAVSGRLGIPVIYDSHEYARGMHAERALWAATMSRAIGVIEDECGPRAAGVIAVSDGIANLLRRDLGLKRRPSVVRNLPEFLRPDAATVHRPRLLHYHGILARGRGLELIVDALALLPAPHRLRLVGPERQPGFVAGLRERAARRGVSERLEILPAVPPDRLVQVAGDADFGLCVLDDDSDHNRLALPNKLFEYIMAGLTSVVSDSREMAAVVRRHDAGIVLGERSAEALARAIAGIGDAEVAQTRARNLASAETLNWTREKAVLLDLYSTLGLLG